MPRSGAKEKPTEVIMYTNLFFLYGRSLVGAMHLTQDDFFIDLSPSGLSVRSFAAFRLAFLPLRRGTAGYDTISFICCTNPERTVRSVWRIMLQMAFGLERPWPTVTAALTPSTGVPPMFS